MEQAVHRANAGDAIAQPPIAEAVCDATVLARSPCASLVAFHAEPEALLGAVQSGASLPTERQESVALWFGAGLVGLFEPADAAEAALWHRLETPASWNVLLREGHAASEI